MALTTEAPTAGWLIPPRPEERADWNQPDGGSTSAQPFPTKILVPTTSSGTTSKAGTWMAHMQKDGGRELLSAVERHSQFLSEQSQASGAVFAKSAPLFPNLPTPPPRPRRTVTGEATGVAGASDAAMAASPAGPFPAQLAWNAMSASAPGLFSELPPPPWRAAQQVTPMAPPTISVLPAADLHSNLMGSTSVRQNNWHGTALGLHEAAAGLMAYAGAAQSVQTVPGVATGSAVGVSHFTPAPAATGSLQVVASAAAAAALEETLREQLGPTGAAGAAVGEPQNATQEHSEAVARPLKQVHQERRQTQKSSPSSGIATAAGRPGRSVMQQMPKTPQLPSPKKRRTLPSATTSNPVNSGGHMVTEGSSSSAAVQLVGEKQKLPMPRRSEPRPSRSEAQPSRCGLAAWIRSEVPTSSRAEVPTSSRAPTPSSMPEAPTAKSAAHLGARGAERPAPRAASGRHEKQAAPTSDEAALSPDHRHAMQSPLLDSGAMSRKAQVTAAAADKPVFPQVSALRQKGKPAPSARPGQEKLATPRRGNSRPSGAATAPGGEPSCAVPASQVSRPASVANEKAAPASRTREKEIELDPAPEAEVSEKKVFEIGDLVHYGSKTHKKLIPTIVKAVRRNDQGVVIGYDLKHKENAGLDKVWPLCEEAREAHGKKESERKKNQEKEEQQKMRQQAWREHVEKEWEKLGEDRSSDTIMNAVFAETGFEVCLGQRLHYRKQGSDVLTEGIVQRMYKQNGLPVLDIDDESAVPMDRVAPLRWKCWHEVIELLSPPPQPPLKRQKHRSAKVPPQAAARGSADPTIGARAKSTAKPRKRLGAAGLAKEIQSPFALQTSAKSRFLTTQKKKKQDQVRAQKVSVKALEAVDEKDQQPKPARPEEMQAREKDEQAEPSRPEQKQSREEDKQAKPALPEQKQVKETDDGRERAKQAGPRSDLEEQARLLLKRQSEAAMQRMRAMDRIDRYLEEDDHKEPKKQPYEVVNQSNNHKASKEVKSTPGTLGAGLASCRPMGHMQATGGHSASVARLLQEEPGGEFDGQPWDQDDSWAHSFERSTFLSRVVTYDPRQADLVREAVWYEITKDVCDPPSAAAKTTSGEAKRFYLFHPPEQDGAAPASQEDTAPASAQIRLANAFQMFSPDADEEIMMNELGEIQRVRDEMRKKKDEERPHEAFRQDPAQGWSHEERHARSRSSSTCTPRSSSAEKSPSPIRRTSSPGRRMQTIRRMVNEGAKQALRQNSFRKRDSEPSREGGSWQRARQARHSGSSSSRTGISENVPKSMRRRGRSESLDASHYSEAPRSSSRRSHSPARSGARNALSQSFSASSEQKWPSNRKHQTSRATIRSRSALRRKGRFSR